VPGAGPGTAVLAGSASGSPVHMLVPCEHALGAAEVAGLVAADEVAAERARVSGRSGMKAKGTYSQERWWQEEPRTRSGRRQGR
jgi:hypothetical protein